MEYKTDKLRPTQPFLVLETQDFKQEIYLNQGISHFYTFRLEKTKEITTVPDSCVDMLFEYGENGMNAYAICSPIRCRVAGKERVFWSKIHAWKNAGWTQCDIAGSC